MKCTQCNAKIKTHLWIVDERVYCTPKCERWTPKYKNKHRYSDSVVEAIGVAGLKQKYKK